MIVQKRQITLAGVVLGVALGGATYLHARQAPAPAAKTASAVPAPAAGQGPSRTFVTQYCVTCHNTRAKTAGLMLDTVDVDAVGANAEIWEKVVRKLHTGSMPPAAMPRPDKATYQGFITSLENALDKSAAASPNPGRPTAVHRLNRVEYANAIRDLLALEIDGTAMLPGDNSSYGFD